jgi:heme-degrading monooxygenase HmoA
MVGSDDPEEKSMEFAVVTRVKVQPGSIDELAALFDATNRDLVASHDDWLGALFTANRDTDEVTVIARWSNPDAYQRLRQSEEFQATMARFGEKFVGPPSVSTNEILVEM